MADFATALSAVRVAVLLPDKTAVKGLNRFDDEGTPVQTFPLEEAFAREWETDAHFVLYLTTPFDVNEPFFRLNKPILPEVRARGADVHCRLAVVEYDTGEGKEHVPWTPETFQAFQALYQGLRESQTPIGARLRSCAMSYATRRGWRFVYLLSKGVPADDFEPLIRGLIAEHKAAGLRVDEAPVLATWNIDFRLPRVTRDGKKTSEDPFFCVEIEDWTKTIDPASIIPLGKADPGGFLAVDDPGGRPTADEVEAMLSWINAQGHSCDTPFTKYARKQLAGQVYHPHLFECLKTPDFSGARHDSFRTWTLSAAGHIAKAPDASAAHLYAMFYKAAEQIHASDPSRNIFHDLWRLSKGAWNLILADRLKETQAEETKTAEQQVKQQAQAVALVFGQERIVQGVRKWFPMLPMDPQASWAWIKKRFILKSERKYYVMKDDGTYSGMATDAAGVVPRIVQLKMDSYMPVEVEGKEGKRPIKKDEWHLAYVRNVDKIEYRGQIEGAYLEDPEKDEDHTLVLPSYRRRTDLVPTYSSEVDGWLMALGGSQYETLIRHIGCFLAFERGGVAAMSFQLAPGAGKKMLTHGFLECMESSDHATGDDLVQKFNGKLEKTGFLFVNEGLPDARKSYHHPADTLRKVITGDYFQVERKGIDATNSKIVLRILMTANGWRLIDALGEGRDLSPHEREALGQRIVHYKTDELLATEFLKAQGGYDFTRGWIQGDEQGKKTPSQYIVAKHFLWLYEMYGKNAPIRGRLLIEGDPNQEAILRLRVRGGSTPEVVRTILAMADDRSPGPNTGKRILEKDGRLFVTTGAIQDFWQRNLSQGSSEKLTMHKISLSLKGLIVSDDKPGKRSIEGLKELWHELDVDILAREAREYGWSCRAIDSILAMRASGALHKPPTPNTPNGEIK